MMKRKIVIVAVAALAVATATTAFFYNLLSDQFGPRVDADAAISVAVATRDLPRGRVLEAADLRLEPWKPEDVPAEAARSLSGLEGGRLAVSVDAGQPVLMKYLPAAGRSGISAAIPSGMRAVTLHVNEYAGVTSLIEMGDRVDVLVANQLRSPGRLGMQVRTLLENVEVLATGRDSDGQSREIPTITVLIQAADAERVSLADQSGAILLALRNPADQEELNLSEGPALTNGPVPQARAAVRRRPAPPTSAAAKPPVERPEPKTVAGDRRHVVFALRFAGLGDQALEDFTAAVHNRVLQSPLIVSTFRPEWDAQALFERFRREDGLQVFAEPNLITLEDTEARFEKSSEAALEQSAEPIEVDRVGVRVSLKPELQPDGSLEVRITSEAAIPDPSHTLTLAGAELPRVSVRRSECVIRVADGQSFWIRGLIDRPGAWDLLRRLFPQQPLDRDANDELVILVTPHLRPAGESAIESAAQLSAALQD